MKTIAITIEELTLRLLDQITATSPRWRSRSVLVHAAVREFAAQEQQRDREAQDHGVLHKHRKQLARQARALIAEQARL